MASESQIRRKRGRPLGSKDTNPRKRNEPATTTQNVVDMSTRNVNDDKTPEEVLSHDKDTDNNYKMSITVLGWYRNEVVIDDIFVYTVTFEVMDENENDPQIIE